jgi:hypothetical protein
MATPGALDRVRISCELPRRSGELGVVIPASAIGERTIARIRAAAGKRRRA